MIQSFWKVQSENIEDEIWKFYHTDTPGKHSYLNSILELFG